MHSIHEGQRALSLGSWQSGSPWSQSALGKGQAAGEQKLRGGCRSEAGLGCEADIFSARQELAAAPGHPGRDRGPSGHRVPRPFGGCTKCSAAHRRRGLLQHTPPPPRAPFCFFSQTGEAQLFGEPFCLVFTSSHE